MLLLPHHDDDGTDGLEPDVASYYGNVSEQLPRLSKKTVSLLWLEAKLTAPVALIKMDYKTRPQRSFERPLQTPKNQRLPRYRSVNSKWLSGSGNGKEVQELKIKEVMPVGRLADTNHRLYHHIMWTAVVVMCGQRAPSP